MKQVTFGPQADLEAARNFVDMWEGSLAQAKSGDPNSFFSVAEAEEGLAAARQREREALDAIQLDQDATFIFRSLREAHESGHIDSDLNVWLGSTAIAGLSKARSELA